MVGPTNFAVPLASEPWRRDAACRGAPLDLFYPDHRLPLRERRRLEAGAVEVCSGCPVSAECLAAALADPQIIDFGIRGGTTAKQRRSLRRPVGRAEKFDAPARTGDRRHASLARHKNEGRNEAGGGRVDV